MKDSIVLSGDHAVAKVSYMYSIFILKILGSAYQYE